MPNIPQINVGGTVYKLKDADAQEQINDLKSALSLINLIKENLFDAASITEGYYITNTGVKNPNATWGYIQMPALPSTKYSITGGRSIVCFYNGSTVISGDIDSTPNKIITTPANTTLMVVSVLLANKNAMFVARSDSLYSLNFGAIKGTNDVVHPATYSTTLPDANKAIKNSVYRFFGFEKATSNIPANLPFIQWPYEDNDEAFLLDVSNVNSDVYREQLFVGKNTICARAYSASNNAWYAWKELISSPIRIEVDVNHPGYRDYASLTRAIIENANRKNVTIIVYPGEYDMIQEIAELYGEDYLDNISERWFGCTYLGNGMRIVFAEGAHIKCNYTGSNAYIRDYFSPFNAAAGGFTLENLNISCSGVRYCVHDERSSDSDVYQNYYLNCQMYKDSENGAIQQQCIGGGLGRNGEIIIKDCYFDGDKNDTQILVSYHNSAASDAQSKVVVEGCYFNKRGRLRFAHYGNSTNKTMCICHGNSFGDSIEVAYETSSYHVENIEVVAWGNEVRE